jgi:hypothetical protein
MPADSRRLSILTAREIDDLYGLPRFTEDDRHLYFDLSAAERTAVGAVRTASSAIHLVLQLGYFKAKQQFFVYAREAVLDDLEHIRRRYFPERDLDTIKPLSKPTRLEQQQIILKLFDFRLCDAEAKQNLERKAQRIAQLSTQPHLHSARDAAVPYEPAYGRARVHLPAGPSGTGGHWRAPTHYSVTGSIADAGR